ncbi:MAG: FG-GAP repeat domain-containing protein [Sphingomicrobium sp.]
MARIDFDGDGRSDIIWGNHRTGYVSNWLGTENGGFFINDAIAMDPYAPGTLWATGDFDGDGLSDTLWRNAANEIFLAHTWEGGGYYFGWSAGLVATIPPEWRIYGAGDFDGDGLDDILWVNDNGTVSNWLSNGDYEFTINDHYAMTSILADWPIQGIGDFDGDGRDDLVVRHGETLDLMFATQTGAFEPSLGPFASIQVEWQIAGVGDFNGDGNADLLWRHSNGAISNWLYDGGVGSQTFEINDANAFVNVSNDWQIAGVGDYDGDGRDDLLWRNVDSGAVSDWLATETGGWIINDPVAYADVSTDWTILPNTAGAGFWDY